MSRVHFNNDAYTLASAGGISDTDTSAEFSSSIPTLASGEYVLYTLTDGTDHEIIKIDDNTGAPTYTITRAQEGTTARAWSNGATIECRITKGSTDDKQDSVDTGTRNVYAGEGALDSITSATDATAYGYNALNALTSSTSKNTAVGAYALSSTTNQSNTGMTAVGYEAGKAAASAPNTTAIGYQAGLSLTSGGWNTFIGHKAGADITTNNSNVAVGSEAMGDGLNHVNSVAVGRNALKNTGTNSNQTAVGYIAGSAGLHNTYMGYSAGGGSVSTSRNYNVGIGYESLFGRTGDSNTSLGYRAGKSNNTGDDNVFIGYNAAISATTGNNNIVIGSGAEKSATTVSNEFTLGNSSIATLRCQQTSITALSDKRDKDNIKDLSLGLDFINSLKPSRWTWQSRDGKHVGYDDIGFIAQDLDKAQKAYNAEYLNLVLKSNPDKLEATPGRLLPVLIKAVQELSAEVERLKAAK